MYATLYKQVCLRVCREAVLSQDGSRHLVLPSAFAARVEQSLVEQFDEWVRSGMESRSWHQLQLSRYRKEWEALRSDHTCLSCLCRRPMYTLPCAHMICQECVKIFGRKVDGKVRLELCLLCGRDTVGFQIGIKPDTATVRILSIDGGGTRARVPLGFLQEIQDCVGLPYPVQHNFDIIFGTSSGTQCTYHSLSPADILP